MQEDDHIGKEHGARPDRLHRHATAHLKDQDIEVDFSQVTTPQDRIAIVATEPLTDNERWIAFSTGQLIAFQDGAPLAF